MMRREKLKYLVTTQQGRIAKKDVGWTNKVAKSRTRDTCTKSGKGLRCMEGHDRLP